VRSAAPLPAPRRPVLYLVIPRDVGRAELGPAPRAKLGGLEVLRRQRLVVQLARPGGVERQAELLVPVEREPRARQRVVALACARTPAGDVGRVRGDLVGDHAFAHLLGVWQAEVLLAGYVAQHVRPVP